MGDFAESGWFAVAWSDEIPVGGVEPLLVAGREYVLYRDEDGLPHVLDAHCRHLGAHLGYGGVVEGAALRCPFHGWCWQPDGACSDVPYSKRVPPGARIGTWPSTDRFGVVCAWLGTDAGVVDDLPLLEDGDRGSSSGTRLRFRTESRAAEVEARLFSVGHVAAAFGLEPAALTSHRVGGGSMLLYAAEGERPVCMSVFLTPLDPSRLDVRVALGADGDDSMIRAFARALWVEIDRLEGVVA